MLRGSKGGEKQRRNNINNNAEEETLHGRARPVFFKLAFCGLSPQKIDKYKIDNINLNLSCYFLVYRLNNRKI